MTQFSLSVKWFSGETGGICIKNSIVMGIAMNYYRHKFDSFVIFFKGEYDFRPKIKKGQKESDKFNFTNISIANIAKTNGNRGFIEYIIYMNNFIYTYL